MLYDLFICHASEDKDSFVRPLAEALQKENVEVWYDEFSLKIGDSIRRSIDKGLSQSRFGVVVLSDAFFSKQWTQYELDGLVEREMAGQSSIILPIWHNIDYKTVVLHSPSLANRKAVLTNKGLDNSINEILKVIHPQGSPLIVARDMVLEWGLKAPVVTDAFWLNVAEASNRSPAFGAVIPENAIWGRWSFPLPDKEDGAEQWGEKLAWTAMQMNWVETAERIPISPLTPPENVHEFIQSHPGLYETCLTFPSLIAEYAPQLTIHGNEGPFEEVFEKEYNESIDNSALTARSSPSFGTGVTTNKKPPICDEIWALRHPDFGFYTPSTIADAYFRGGMFGPRVSPYENVDHVFWLLSAKSAWLPKEIHACLLEGMLDDPSWPWGYYGTDKGGNWETNGELYKSLFKAIGKKSFRLTKKSKNDLEDRINSSIIDLQLPETCSQLVERFTRLNFFQRWIAAQQKLKKRQNLNK